MATPVDTQVAPEPTATGPAIGGAVPGAGGSGRALATVGIVVAGAVALVAIFLVGSHNTTGLPKVPPFTSIAQPAAPATGVIAVSLTDFKVGMPLVVAAGQVTFTIHNGGAVVHELLVFSSALDVHQYPTLNGGINEEGAGITKDSDGDNLDPGATQTRTVDLTVPGTYVFTCNLPGHFAAGMATTVVVK
jgi:uncharacterized cupredoxin-like copper-binding protein